MYIIYFKAVKTVSSKLTRKISVIVAKQEEKKTGKGLRIRARLRLLKRNLFGSSESGADKKKTSASSGKKAAAAKEPRRNNRGPVRSVSGEARKTNRPQEKNRNAKPRTERASGPAPEKKVTRKKTPPPLPEIVEAPAEEGKTRFTELPLAKEILAAVQTLGFRYCTPIQALCLPAALEGRDLAAKAQTGTGKTAAFLASCMTRLIRNPIPEDQRKPGACRVLVLSPTRELAIQIHNDALGLGQYTTLNNLVIFGGMDHKEQRNSLADPVDILVGTPGRILDYLQSGHLDLSRVETLVIDEADRMLDMGFIPDVRRIVGRLPKAGVRQTMLFSATLEPEILRLVDKWLVDPVSFETEPEHVVTDLIDQHFYAVMREEKLAFLLWLIRNEPFERMIIFGNWKERNSELVDQLYEYGVDAGLLSGDIPQTKRLQILERFKKGDLKVVVATDVAARGIHIPGISHVVNYDLPDHPEDYVHRIGRTGRAGANGKSISFVCEYGAYVMPQIEEYAQMKIKTVLPEEDQLVLPEKVNPARRKPASRSGSHRSGGRSGGRPSGRRR